MPSKTITGCSTAAGCWDVPNIPNAQLFTCRGHALHGTYWHNQFGIRNMSYSCINLTQTDAAWLYSWAQVDTDVVVIR